jgi:hypothetical protein
MIPSDLNVVATSTLVERYVANALAQYKAARSGAFRRFKPLAIEQRALEEELQRRPGDERRALVDLCEHPNTQVRLNAAVAVLAVAPERARKALELLVEARLYPQSAEAGMTLDAIDSGQFVPT